MKFIDFFAGIGGFRKGFELAGHKCVGFCEWDRFAAASYISMHLLTDTQREELEKLSLQKRQKEILKEVYRNGEWYANDIRNVDAGSMPKSNCWCFGAPCQDFSIAGKRAGLDGGRSSLVCEIFRLLEGQEEQNRPEWLIYENVKGMFSSNRGLDYLSIVLEMDRLGYDIEWQNINSSWFVPQNRERIYTIGHLRTRGRAKILPITAADGKNHLEEIGEKPSKLKMEGRIYGENGIMRTLGHGHALSQPYAGIKAVGTPWSTSITKSKSGELFPVTLPNGVICWCVWNKKRQSYLTVRKLTPKECFRLQGWSDDYFEKAAFVNSDSQLYKQAGNGVTVDVVETIGKKLLYYEVSAYEPEKL